MHVKEEHLLLEGFDAWSSVATLTYAKRVMPHASPYGPGPPWFLKDVSVLAHTSM